MEEISKALDGMVSLFGKDRRETGPMEIFTLPKTNSKRPWKEAGHQKETIVFQPSMSRCELLVSGRVNKWAVGNMEPQTIFV